MERRRRPRPVPRDIFSPNTVRRIRDETETGRAEIADRRRQAIETVIQGQAEIRRTYEERNELVEEAATQDQSKKEWRVLKSPSSPPILVPTNQQLSRQTDSVRSDIESSFQQRKTRDRKRVVTDIADLSEVLSEFKKEEKDTIKNWLLSERIPKIQAQGDKLSEERGLSQSEMWTDEDVATLYRQLEVLQYEAAKDENNGFLKCFDISSLNGSNIRALNLLNETLLKSQDLFIREGLII
ncbi:uncharacterized protein METZ01_LOCUS423452, partial [marine metagenome]